MALEIRCSRLAFAVLQQGELLDWGARSFPPEASGNNVARTHCAFLLRLYAPFAVVARRPRHSIASARAIRVFASVRAQLRLSAIPFFTFTQHEIREAFTKFGCRRKHDIATLLAERFAQLSTKLPRPRKAWDKERWAVAVFDALATAVAFEILQESIPER